MRLIRPTWWSRSGISSWLMHKAPIQRYWSSVGWVKVSSGQPGAHHVNSVSPQQLYPWLWLKMWELVSLIYRTVRCKMDNHRDWRYGAYSRVVPWISFWFWEEGLCCLIDPKVGRVYFVLLSPLLHRRRREYQNIGWRRSRGKALEEGGIKGYKLGLLHSPLELHAHSLVRNKPGWWREDHEICTDLRDCRKRSSKLSNLAKYLYRKKPKVVIIPCSCI